MESFHTGLPPAGWDDSVKAMGGHFLQSSAWAKVMKREGREVVYGYSEGDWLVLAGSHEAKGLRYLICNYGPAVASNARQALSELVDFARSTGYDFVRVEPTGRVTAEDIRSAGGRKISQHQPQHTWVLDLDKTEEELRLGMRSGHRNYVNTAQKRGIAVTQDESANRLDEFLAMLNDTAKRSGTSFHSAGYFKDLTDVLMKSGNAKLFTASFEGKPVAMAMFYDFNGTRYYAHAGAYQELNRQLKASVVLVWEAILDAKRQGFNTFDFWGIAPTDDPSHPWAGISSFKKAYGGRQVDYLGTWDIPVNAGKYRLYSAYRRLKGLKDL